MNQELFVNALSSLLVVSDCAEFLDTRRSFIIDSLCKLGCPKDAAVSYLMTCGAVEQKRAEQYINEIEHQGLSDEFEQWDSLCKLGCPKDAAVSYLMTCGAVEQKRAEQYINEIEHQGLSDEFEQWSNQDEVIEERKYGILTALSLGIGALNHPHRFH